MQGPYSELYFDYLLSKPMLIYHCVVPNHKLNEIILNRRCCNQTFFFQQQKDVGQTTEFTLAIEEKILSQKILSSFMTFIKILSSINS